MKIDILNNYGRCEKNCPFRNGGYCLLFKEDLRYDFEKVPKTKYKIIEFSLACSECNHVVEKQKENEQYQ